jgi:PAS domain S-box-containing protein
VVGFAEADGFSPKLIQALVRKTGQSALPQANPLDIMDAELSTQDATRAQIDAIFLGSSSKESLQILELQELKGERTFSALMPTNYGGLPPIPIGSRVRLQGVFKAATDTLPDFGQVITSFQMFLNSPEDLLVLERPAWWTARHTLWFSMGAGIVVLVSLGSVALLRRQVRQRTRELHDEILERQRAEEALSESASLYHSLVESLPQNILRKDLQGRFTFANAFFCRTIGKSIEQIIGKTDYDLFPRAFAEKFRQDDQKVLASGKPFQTVEDNRNAAGENIYVEVIKTPLCDSEKRLVGLQIIFWDVTSRKQAEDKLEQVHRQLLETSRRAGMAEVATSVLHNVGNVLNSVNVSASLVCDTLKKSKTSSLSKLASLITEHESDLGHFFSSDSRAKPIPVYLTQLAAHLVAQEATAIAELEELTKHIEHIKDIVSMQQGYAKVSGVAETVHAGDLVEDALRMNASALARHEIQIVRQYDPHLPSITVEKHKVLQILVNLIRNAKYACDEADCPDKRMTLRLRNGAGRIKIDIIDNGIGIRPENLTRIFSLGFTTRKDGHGFGLHSGALAARDLGGSLTVHSDGPGQGAAFTLELPLDGTEARR